MTKVALAIGGTAREGKCSKGLMGTNQGYRSGLHSTVFAGRALGLGLGEAVVLTSDVF